MRRASFVATNDFRKQLDERRMSLKRPGIVPVDPVDALEGAPKPPDSRKAQKSGTTEEQNLATASPQPTPAIDPRTQPVPPGEAPIKVGWHMYPTRHRQVLYEAFMRDMNPWEINEIALAEYFARRYGDAKDVDH